MDGKGRGGEPTGEDVRLLGKAVPVMGPFRGVSVYRPAFKKLGHAEPIEDLVGGAVDVAVDCGLGIFGGDVDDHRGYIR